MTMTTSSFGEKKIRIDEHIVSSEIKKLKNGRDGPREIPSELLEKALQQFSQCRGFCSRNA